MNVASSFPPMGPSAVPTKAPAFENPRTSPTANASEQNAQGLDVAQLEQLADLKARDREVRAHEAAHQAVGGQYAGAISYVYERGPDGAQYAVGGEVSIDTAPVEGDPQATIEKMPHGPCRRPCTCRAVAPGSRCCCPGNAADVAGPVGAGV